MADHPVIYITDTLLDSNVTRYHFIKTVSFKCHIELGVVSIEMILLVVTLNNVSKRRGIE